MPAQGTGGKQDLFGNILHPALYLACSYLSLLHTFTASFLSGWFHWYNGFKLNEWFYLAFSVGSILLFPRPDEGHLGPKNMSTISPNYIKDMAKQFLLLVYDRHG